MKPTTLKIGHCSSYIDPAIGFNLLGKISSIKGNVKKNGATYPISTVILYNRKTYMPVCITKPNTTGGYKFAGISDQFSAIVIGLDDAMQYNAVIQDNVVPK